MIISLTLSSMVFQYQAVMFVAIGITSFQRKLFFAKMAGSLINLNDDSSYKECENQPTLCVFKRNNIAAWLKLKDAIIDIGSNYNQRVTLFTSFMFLLGLLEALFFICSFFRIVTLEITNVFWACGLLDILIIGSIILIVI